ncbi:MAG: matrixin family metalloprotease [Casimicrobiaceae bacterium]
MSLRARCCVVALLLILAPGVSATPDVPDYVFRPVDRRTGEAAVPVPKYLYLFGSPATWQGPLRWKYNHANAPPAFAANKTGAIAQIHATLGKWTAVCAISFAYDGETFAVPNTLVADSRSGVQPDGENVVGWGPISPGRAAETYGWYAQVGAQLALIDADIVYSTTHVVNAGQLDRVSTHEWGHALGLAHSNDGGAVMAGPPDSAYNGLADLQSDDVRGCRCLYGPAAGQTAGYSCSLPRNVDFVDVAIGSASVLKSVVFANNGNAPLTIDNVLVDTSEFAKTSGCGKGTTLVPGASCVMQVIALPAGPGTRVAELNVLTPDDRYRVPLAAVGTAAPPPPAVEVIEFFHAGLDHYFISSSPADIQALDSGALKGWVRTGQSFGAYATAQPGTSPVCRFYLPPPHGDSHFYSASPTECAETKAKFPSFVFEAAAAMHIVLPSSSGACPADTRPVYRVWNNRADTNHRYATDRTIRDAMVAKGGLAEGYGAIGVTMCANP